MSVSPTSTGATATRDAALEQRCVDTIRSLAIDGVERAGSGHPGMPLGMAPVAYALFARALHHNPEDPLWPDRDRFVLSAGHASMLLYAALHLTGYDLPIDELRHFRQWGSRTPGHPERDRVHVTPGVETTTGPLGQGFTNAVGMAMAERFLRERYTDQVVDHRTFAMCSDGDLMEGISAEAASLAGHLGLGRLVVIYDDNQITIDGPTSLAFATEDVEARFRAYGWHTSSVEDANDLDAIEAAIASACAQDERPTLVRVRSVIGWPAPTKQGTAGAHGAALGAEEVRATKQALGLDPDQHFHVPADVREHMMDGCRERGAAAQRAWEERFSAWREREPELAAEWDAAQAARPSEPVAPSLPIFDPAEHAALATRSAGAAVMQAFAPLVPTMVGGAADLVESTKTEFKEEASFTREHAGRNVHWGVREHAMGAAVNGLAQHGGIVRPYGSTFLIFSDYMRPAIRLSALMKLPVAWVFTHDSVGLGEDGPTHQPVEHLLALRAIPGLVVLRPADAAETAQAWRVTLEEVEGPVCLVLSRQDLPVLDRDALAGAEGLARGAYVLAEADADGPTDAILVATGSEVALALEARTTLAAEGLGVRVVSMPSCELFDAQDGTYRAEVLPAGVPTIAVEAAVTLGWERYAHAAVGIDRFGASAPGAEALTGLGMTSEEVCGAVRNVLRADTAGA